MDPYNEFIDKLKEKFEQFYNEAKNAENTKAAGQRARKVAQELRSDLKSFRATSLEREKE